MREELSRIQSTINQSDMEKLKLILEFTLQLIPKLVPFFKKKKCKKPNHESQEQSI